MIETAHSEPPHWAASFISSPERLIASLMALFAACIIGLTGRCLYVFPTLRTSSSDGLISALALVLIALVYGLIGWFGSQFVARRKSPILRLSLPWGAGAGVMFALSLLGEYVVPHENRHGEMVALGVFGTFFVILFAAGVFATRATRSVITGALAGFWTAVIATELWVLFLFLVYLSFVGTAQEARFLEVDQTIADFERSREPDLRAFIFSDYAGAAFFHSLLGAVFGLLLGGLGGLAVLAVMPRPRVVRDWAKSNGDRGSR
jgi:hypothetical protein